jgi:hypothetical protein
MILKGTLAAAMVAALVAFSPAPAKADTDIRIGIGFGYWGGGVCGGGYYRPGYRCWPRYYGGRWTPYWYPGHIRYAPAYYGFSCREARWIVREYGFRNIRAENCRGRVYTFIGWRGGHPHLIKVRRGNGAIVSVRHI